MDRNNDIITFIQNTFISRKPREANFAEMKIGIMFIKTSFEDSNKVKSFRSKISKKLEIIF